jgi:hypothetical protein
MTSVVQSKLESVFKKVVTVEEFLSTVLSPEDFKAAVAEFRFRDEGIQYQELLFDTWMGLNGDVTVEIEALRDGGGFLKSPISQRIREEEFNLKQLVDFTIVRLLVDRRSTNVLTYGSDLQDTDRAVSYVVNTARSSLCTFAWEALFQRIDKALMYFILSQTSVFRALPNNCYIQITGDDVLEVMNASRDKTSDNSVTVNGQRSLHSRACDIHILKQKAFYGTPFLDSMGVVIFGLAPSFPLCLSRKQKDIDKDTQTKMLLVNIFPIPFKRRSPLSIHLSTKSAVSIASLGVPKRLRVAQEMANSMIARHRHLQFHRFMNQCCPPDGFNSVPFHQVSAFCKLVVRHALPVSAFGSRHNWNKIYQSIDKFIHLRRREFISLLYLFEGLRIKEIPWLGDNGRKLSLSDYSQRQELLLQFLHWLFSVYLVMLIRTNFYVTERSAESASVYYYRQDVWKKIYNQAMQEFKRDRLTAVASHLEPMVAEASLLGFSDVRLVPKNTGFRTITTLGKGAKQNGKQLPSVNSQLEDLHKGLILGKQLYHKTGPACIGNIDQLLPRLAQYRSEQMDRNEGILPKFYVLKFDISKCFDTIDPILAYRLARDLLRGDQYWLQKFKVYDSRPTGLNWGRNRIIARDVNRSVLTAEEAVMGICKTSRDRIVVDKCPRRAPSWIASEKLAEVLDDHLRNCLIKIDGHLYKQAMGIPQGSTLSTMLCDLVYDKLEHDCLIYDPMKSVLFRYVDDFLFISSDLQEAESFLKTMSVGFDRFGAYINPAKTMASFETDVIDPSPLLLMDDLVSYVGWTLDCRTLDPVFTRQDSTSTIANSLAGSGGRAQVSSITSKLRHSLRYRLRRSALTHVYEEDGRLLQYFENICLNLGKKVIMFDKKCLRRGRNYATIVQWVSMLIETIVSRYVRSVSYEARKRPVEVRVACAMGFNKVFSRTSSLEPVVKYVSQVYLRGESELVHRRPTRFNEGAIRDEVNHLIILQPKQQLHDGHDRMEMD